MDLGKLTGPSNQNSPFLNLVIGVLAGAAVFFVAQKFTAGDPGLLARVDDTPFREESLGTAAQARASTLEAQRHGVLSESVLNWIDGTVLSKEAAARGISAEELVKQEVLPKLKITPEDVLRRYADSPQAEKAQMPYDPLLQDIASDMRGTEFIRLQKEYVATLYPKHRITNYLKAPEGYRVVVRTPPGRYPAYRVPEAAPELDANGNVTGAPYTGPKNARVVIEVYSDFMCPFSAKFSETTNRISKEYADKVRIEYHHNPLSFHKGADIMAEASVCAQEQGKFWVYHDALFSSPGGKSPDQLAALAKGLGLEPDRFAKCLESRKYQAFVTADTARGTAMGATGTPSWFINGRFRSGALPYEMTKPLIDWLLDPKGPAPANPTQKPAAPAPGAPQPPGVPVVVTEQQIGSSPSRGPSKAAVTMIEFVDFQCGYCKRAAAPSDDLFNQFKGKMRFVSKNMPLSEATMPMANAALCANDQGKYWEYRKALFAATGALADEALKKQAADMRLNTKTFNACVDSKKHVEEIKKDTAFAQSVGVSGTPTYLVNGQVVVGFNPDAMKKLLEEKLEK